MFGSSEFHVEPLRLDAGSLDVRYITIAFFALSALFQFGGGVAGRVWARWLRFIEYSFSASIMIMAIAVEAGIDDVYMLQAMFVLMWTTQMLGLLAEVFGPMAPVMSMWLLPHLAGWVTFLSAYAPILDAFLQSKNNSPSVSPPDFVEAMVFLQCALFGCFGGVQLYALIKRGAPPTESFSIQQPEWEPPPAEDSLDDTVDKAYILLSITAKSILGWLIVSPLWVHAGDR
jgi:hypothetical protein